jgi:superfamily II DNA or RNA helicase
MKTIKLLRSKQTPHVWIPNTLPKSVMGVLDKAMSYETVGYEYTEAWANGEWDGITRLMKQASNKAWFFPEGLLPRVRKILNAFGYKIEYKQRHAPNPKLDLTWNGPALREYQNDVVTQTMKKLTAGEGCIVNLPTGGGKSICGMRIIYKLQVPTLITVHNKELMMQWVREISHVLGYVPSIYGGGKKEKDGLITVAMVQTLTKDKNFPLNRFDLLLADEIHHYSAPTFEKVAMKCNSYYRMGLSATTRREDGAEMKFIGGIGSIIQPIDAKQLIKEGYLTKPKLIILRPPAPPKLGKDWQEEYTNGIVLNEKRNKLIAKTAWQYTSEGKQIYINVKMKEHGEKLASMINCDFIHASSKNRIQAIDDFACGEKRIIISTLLGEGVDIPGIDVIIMASAGKSTTATIQKAGRVLRIKKGKKEAIIVDFADSGRRLRNHFEKRREAYREILGV